MKKHLYWILLLNTFTSYARTLDVPQKSRLEINFQRHLSFRQIQWLDTTNDQDNDQFGYAPPHIIENREKEDSPVYSFSLGIKYNYNPIKWTIIQFGLATGTKGFGSESFVSPDPSQLGAFQITSKYKPLPFVEISYAIGPNLSICNNQANIFASIGHTVHFGINRNLDKFMYKGIYSVKSKKGFTYSNVKSEQTTLTPFMTILNLGLIYKLDIYTIGINASYEWNAKKYVTSTGLNYHDTLFQNYIYSLSINFGIILGKNQKK